jgi:hypothetical protein
MFDTCFHLIIFTLAVRACRSQVTPPAEQSKRGQNYGYTGSTNLDHVRSPL